MCCIVFSRLVENTNWWWQVEGVYTFSLLFHISFWLLLGANSVIVLDVSWVFFLVILISVFLTKPPCPILPHILRTFVVKYHV